MPPALARDSFGTPHRSTPSGQQTRRPTGRTSPTFCICISFLFWAQRKGNMAHMAQIGRHVQSAVPFGPVYQISFALSYPATGTLTHIQAVPVLFSTPHFINTLDTVQFHYKIHTHKQHYEIHIETLINKELTHIYSYACEEALT